MKQEFQQAIVAARSGKTKEAQFLLAQVLQNDPQDAQAWFLLSNLVEDGALQQDYLGKVLAIEPEHEKAQQHLMALQETAVPVTEDLPDLDRVMADMETAVDELPYVLDDSVTEDDWLATTIGDETPVREEPKAAPPPIIMPEPESTIAPSLSASEDKQLVPAVKIKPPKSEKPAKKGDRDVELAKLNRQLYVLVGIAVIVLIIFLLTVIL